MPNTIKNHGGASTCRKSLVYTRGASSISNGNSIIHRFGMHKFGAIKELKATIYIKSSSIIIFGEILLAQLMFTI